MPKWDNEPPKSNVRPSPPMPPDAAAGDTTATVPHDTYIINFKTAVSYKIFITAYAEYQWAFPAGGAARLFMRLNLGQIKIRMDHHV